MRGFLALVGGVLLASGCASAPESEPTALVSEVSPSNALDDSPKVAKKKNAQSATAAEVLLALRRAALLRMGAEGAPVHIAILCDATSPLCKPLGPFLQRIDGQFSKQVFVSLHSVVGSETAESASAQAALALLAAARQGAWRGLLEHISQAPWEVSAEGLLPGVFDGNEQIEQERLQHDMQDSALHQSWHGEVLLVRQLGPLVLPTVWVDGIRYTGVAALRDLPSKLAKSGTWGFSHGRP